jgi:hypothetical protein
MGFAGPGFEDSGFEDSGFACSGFVCSRGEAMSLLMAGDGGLMAGDRG